ncbi:hypothetical protein AB835_11460 [Candidatus Endobugula sertula]|uniref:Ribosome association toxin RatA n=1 Tax=Candidatus Endobugula sertula TaxID=62101 RepID=A0A1D2QN22_9GAMM|nr:hypothetical protein AB835_11460 [Candidatus Endobugula sertula]
MIKRSKLINASQSELFDLTQNYEKRLAWDPFPESYRFLNGNIVDKGLRLNVKAKNGLSMEVEYVSFKRPKVAAIKMLNGPWFIRKFAGSWSFHSIDINTTEVVFKYTIVGMPSWISPFINLIFANTAEKRLSALKKYVD